MDKKVLIIAGSVVAIAVVVGIVGPKLFSTGPSAPDVHFQVFRNSYPNIVVGDNVTLTFNAVNNDPKSYESVIVRLTSDNPDAVQYLAFDHGDIELGSLGPAQSATNDVSRVIVATDGAADNFLKFTIRAKLLVNGFQTDEKALDISINPK